MNVYNVYRVVGMSSTVCVRLSEELIKDLEEFLREEKLDRSSGLRKLLREAIGEWKKRRALEKLGRGEVSFSRAAEMAEMDLWSFANLVEKSGISWTDRGVKEDLEAI